MRRFCLLAIVLLCACQLISRPASQPANEFSVRVHPDGDLVVGDQVSFEIIPPSGWENQGQQVQVSLAAQVLGSSGFAPFGVGWREQATLWWVWDTKELSPGEQTLSFSILPDGAEWQETVLLQPAGSQPEAQAAQAAWASTVTDCCEIFYITGTDAQRDLESLTQMVDQQAEDVTARLQTEINGQITITFLPRVLGHGGFTSNGIYISYLDENYTGNTTSLVVHHEMVHILDASLGGELLPSILVISRTRPCCPGLQPYWIRKSISP
jgi:hypothetical protein